MYLDYDDTYWIIDIEGDGLPSNRIWCLAYENAITEEKGVLTSYEEIRKFFDDHHGHTFVGHNVLKFDAPTLNRLVATRLPLSRLVDTLVLGTLYSPSISGGHSLKAWGERLGINKREFSDWSKLSDEMIKYCQQDVTVTKNIFLRLVAVLNKLGFTEKSCEIQHKMTHILWKQQKNGFAFDRVEAHKLYSELRQREKQLQELIYHRFPPELKHVRLFKQSTKKDGLRTEHYKRHLEQYPKIVDNSDGSYSCYDFVSFNLGSPKQRVDKLLELGWEPLEFTPKGSPKTTEKGKLVPSLEKFCEESGVEEGRLIAKWIAINGRANMIGTWLDAYNEKTGCIHGNIQVAQTLRFRHDKPNTANIPAVRQDKKTKEVLYGEDGYYTFEARNCWTTRDRERRTLVGTDASGLELRMLAHYLNNPDFTKQVLTGDPHEYNRELAGLDTKPQAKTFIYAFLYGAGDAKIGSIVGGSARHGKSLKARFIGNFGGLPELLTTIREEFSRGRIGLVDGSQVICPSSHSALNYKLQGGGARVMAQGAIFLEDYIRRAGLDSLKVGDIHDEWQYDVANDDSDEHARLAVQALEDSGEELNLNVPITGVSKKGLTWALTH